MEMTRRGLLAAAPEIAKSIATTADAPTPMLTLGGKAIDADRFVENLARARRHARGEISDDEMLHQIGPKVRVHDYEELRSVSRKGRDFLQQRAYEQEQRERLIKAAKEALLQYDRTGIFQHFW